MKKKWLISIGFALAIALLTMPLSGLSSQAKGNDKVMPNQVKLVSGGFFDALPDDGISDNGVPEDGIILGGACTPDVHDFDKKAEDPTIVFIAAIESHHSGDFAVFAQQNVDVYVEVSSNGQKVMDVPLMTFADPTEGTYDYRNGNPLWVGAIHYNSADEGTDLPTGEYSYMFKAKEKGKNGHVLDVWVPKNHKFTITEGVTNN